MDTCSCPQGPLAVFTGSVKYLPQPRTQTAGVSVIQEVHWDMDKDLSPALEVLMGIPQRLLILSK